MAENRHLHEILIADLAYEQGVVDAEVGAQALGRYWKAREEPGARMVTTLGAVAGLSPEQLGPAVEEAQGWLKRAGGDAGRALLVRGGIDAALQGALHALDPEIPKALFRAGVGARIALPRMQEGRYRRFEPYERGAMGVVYWSNDEDMKRQVALKLLLPRGGDATDDMPASPLDVRMDDYSDEELASFQALRPRFVREAWITGGLEHPGIVPVYEIGQTPEGVSYYTMRYVRGERTLGTWLLSLSDPTFEERLELIEPFLKVCDTVAYAHSRDVIHRDLKPDNVAIGQYGEAVVLDWGLATVRRPGEDGQSLWRQVPIASEPSGRRRKGANGTPGYMAPEAAFGAPGEADERLDVYSLGAMLFEILTGRLPVEPESWPEYILKLRDEAAPRADDVAPAVPASLAALCAHALEREPARRLGSVGELARRLRVWQTQRAKEREVEVLLEHAHAGLTHARTARGRARLGALEGVTSACAQIQHLEPDHRSALETQQEAARLRQVGVEEHASAKRRRGVLVTVAAALAVIIGVLTFFLAEIERRRMATADALKRARAQGLVSASLAAHAEPTLSLLLARDAARLDAGPEAVRQLRQALTWARQRARLDASARPLPPAAFSPDGRRIATPTQEGLVKIWRADGQLEAQLERHEAAVTSAVFSPTGRDVLTTSTDGTARLTAVDGSTSRLLFETDAPVLHGAFHPDGREVLVGTASGHAVVIAVEDGAERARLDHAHPVAAVAYAPNGRHVLSVTGKGPARVWATGGELVATLGERGRAVVTATFSPDSHEVATACEQGGVQRWNLDGELQARRGPQGVSANMAVCGPGGTHWAAALHDRAYVWPIAGGEASVLRGHRQAVLSVAFAPSGRWLVTSSMDGTARIWSTEGDLVALLRGHRDWVTSAIFSRDGEQVLTTSDDGSAMLWAARVADEAAVRPPTDDVQKAWLGAAGDAAVVGTRDDGAWGSGTRRGTHYEGRMVMAVDRHGGRVVMEGPGATLRLWDAEGSLIGSLVSEAESPSAVTAAAFGARGELLVTAHAEGEAHVVRCWDATEGDLRATLPHAAEVEVIAVAPDGDVLATGDAGGKVLVWRSSGELVAGFELRGSGVCALAFSPEGNRLAAAPQVGGLRMWDLSSQAPTDLGPDEGRWTHLVFAPNGRRLLTSSSDVSAPAPRLWELEGEPDVILAGHRSGVATARFVAEGQRVLTASHDGTARLWSVHGRELAAFGDGALPLQDAVVSPETSRIVTLDRDGTIRRWLMDASDLMDLADLRIGKRGYTRSEESRYADLLPGE